MRLATCYTLPHDSGAVGTGTPEAHYRTTRGRRAAYVLRNIATPPGAVANGAHAERSHTA